MSFIITIYTKEGIVMAGDSRTTFPNNTYNYYNDTANKVYLFKNNIGISHCGDCSINNNMINGYIEEFNRKINDKTNVSDVPNLLLKEFSKYNIDTTFHVCGYENINNEIIQKCFQLNTKSKNIQQMNTSYNNGGYWNGNIKIFNTLTNSYKFEWNNFSLQNAIDLSIFAINTTEKMLEFTHDNVNVGGPVDVLIIKPTEAFWVSKKDLHL